MKNTLLAVLVLLPSLGIAETSPTTTRPPTTSPTVPHTSAANPVTTRPSPTNPTIANSTGPNTATTGANPNLPDPATELQVMTERLKLSSSQQNEIKPILVAEYNDRKAILDSKTLTEQQKRDRGIEIHRASLQKIKVLFTPEQMALIEAGQNNPGPSPTHPSTSSPTSPTTTRPTTVATHPTTSPTTKEASPTTDPNTELQYLTERLKLSSSQQSAIKPILVEEFNLRKALEENQILSVQQKREEDAVVNRAAFEKIKALFTPEQLAIADGGQGKPPTSSSTHVATATK